MPAARLSSTPLIPRFRAHRHDMRLVVVPLWPTVGRFVGSSRLVQHCPLSQSGVRLSEKGKIKASTCFATRRAPSRRPRRPGPAAARAALRVLRSAATVRLGPGVATSGQLCCGCMRSAAHIMQPAAEPHVSLHAYNEKRGVRICQNTPAVSAAGSGDRTLATWNEVCRTCLPAAPPASPETPIGPVLLASPHIVSRHELAWANLHSLRSCTSRAL